MSLPVAVGYFSVSVILTGSTHQHVSKVGILAESSSPIISEHFHSHIISRVSYPSMDVYTFQSFPPPQHLLLATVAAVIGPVLLLFAWSCSRRLSQQGPNPPPCKKGWIPWLGVGLQFGKAPLHYIKSVHDEVHI